METVFFRRYLDAFLFLSCHVFVFGISAQALAVEDSQVFSVKTSQPTEGLISELNHILQSHVSLPCSRQKWHQIGEEYQRHFPVQASGMVLKEFLNNMLRECGFPNGNILNQQDFKYWVIKQANQTMVRPVKSAGIWFLRRGNRWFINRVFHDSPAYRAGLKRGDEVLFSDKSFGPIYSYPKELASITSHYRRLPWSSVGQQTVVPEWQFYPQELEKATKRSYSQRKHTNGHQIGYVRLFITYHNQSTLLASHLIEKVIEESDYPVIDLRSAISVGPLSIAKTLHQKMKNKKRRDSTKKLTLIVDQWTDWQFEKLATLLTAFYPTKVVGISTQGQFNHPSYQFFGKGKWLLITPDKNSKGRPSRLRPVLSTEHFTDDLVYSGGDDTLFAHAMEYVARSSW